ncbi:hypothetical protein AB0C02_29495 [Micromonospora sp. NPDC048999]|uniref:hypothetical protein n=1 Tax=Micromonospora sp. NPDC048999 TaxID=3155391 RepID=UPI0033DC7FB9
MTDVRSEDLVARIAGLLSSTHPLRIGLAICQATRVLAYLAPVDRAAVLDRAISLALTHDEEQPAVARRR